MLAAVTISQQSLARLEPVPFTQVTIHDRFWEPRQEVNRKATVQHSLAMLERAGNFLDLELAAKGKREGYKGLLFTDSDLYKVIEGCAYTLAAHPDPRLDKRLDEIIAMIAKAQMDDGYINTWFQVTRPDQRFKNLRDWHELYCAGHMFEAAVAHFQATGKRNFLKVALKYANLIDERFGPNGAPGYCGHPELELALIKLWKATGDRKWFALADRMIENRGTHYFAQEHGTPESRYDGTYWLDDVPIREHREIKGHAVRAAYLMSGAADVARETGDEGIIKMLKRVWRNVTEKRIFITGGIGPSAANEGFTVDYDLPNGTAYQETCASIAMALWGNRMALLLGDAKYADAVEMALYNGMLSGVSLDGKGFFYTNPLASLGNHRREDWFDCACCPPNVLRTIASVGGYAYATNHPLSPMNGRERGLGARGSDSLYVNLYIGGSVSTELGGKKVAIDVATDYPWDGKVDFTIRSISPPPGPSPLGGTSHPQSGEGVQSVRFALRLRKPGWCLKTAVVINGKPLTSEQTTSGYIVLDRAWKKGDKVTLYMVMPAMQVEAHPAVKDDIGKAAIQRGPLIYCAEQVDNATPLDEVVVPRNAAIRPPSFKKDLLGGVVALQVTAEKIAPSDWEGKLYGPIWPSAKTRLTMIPYAFWDNRKPGRMEVWLPTSPPAPRVLGPEGKAKVSLSFTSGNCQPWGINDGIEPAKSGDQPDAVCHFWPHKGGEEWAQYTWTKPLAIKGVKVFWFDDTGRGECRLPESWKLQALVAGKWTEVPLKVTPIEMDKWSDVSFEPVRTTALRLVVRQKEGWASGIHEWKIVLADEE